jgi:putative oxidoreductase
MSRFLERYSEPIYAVLRVVAGLLFACHGSQKLFGFPVAGPPSLNTMMLAAGVIELVCGLLIAIGLLTWLAAFLASGQMAVAYFMVHAKQGFWPLANQGELAALYCFLFLYIAARGGGRYSVDGSRSRGAGRLL